MQSSEKEALLAEGARREGLPDDDGGCSAEPVQPLHIGIPSSFAPTAAAAAALML